MPKVSVLMGIYNCASTLQEALDSLYAQTFQDFDIILCDDGSSDDTYAIAKENASEHQNIILLQNDSNQGLNITLNRCLERARGEYVARMDADDISYPRRFEKEVAFLDTHPEYAIVSCPMFYFDEQGVFGQGRGNGEPSLFSFVKGTPFCHAPCMVRREAYEAVGGYSVDKKLLRVEDYHLWIKIYAAGYRGYMLSEPLYSMRDDRNAVIRRSFRSRINEAYVKHLAIRNLHLPLYSYIFCLKPIVLGLLPPSLYTWLHKTRMAK